DRKGKRHLRTAGALLVLTLTSSLLCYSADLVLIRSKGDPSEEQQELERATQFYGIKLKVVSAADHNAASAIYAAHQNATVAVAIEASSLNLVNQGALL